MPIYRKMSRSPISGVRKRRKIALVWLLLVSSVYLPAELSSVLFTALIGAALSTGGLKIRDYVSIASLPLLALVGLGLASAFGFPLWDVCKDIWHFLLPVISLVAGWVVAEGWAASELQTHLAWFGTLSSLQFLLKALWMVLVENIPFDEKYLWRQAMGAGEFMSVWGLLAIIGILSQTKVESGLKKLYYSAILFNFFAIIISDSRSALVFLIAGIFLIFLPCHLTNRRRIYWILLTVGGSLVILLLGASRGSSSTTLGRLQNMFWEQFSFSFVDQDDVNSKYRAFESLAAANSYLSGSWLTRMFGYGFGKMVDLGMIMTLGLPGEKSDYQFVPILHNGYLYILIKTGMSGFILYWVFLVRNFREFLRKKIQPTLGFWKQIGLTIMISTSMATMVMTGPFIKGDFFTTFLVLGMAMHFCFARKEVPDHFRGKGPPIRS